jgi:hypothetical protein
MESLDMADWKKYFFGITIYILGITQNPAIWAKESHLFALFNSTRFLIPAMAPSVDCWCVVAGRDHPCSAAGTYVIFIINHKQNVLQQQSVSILP